MESHKTTGNETTGTLRNQSPGKPPRLARKAPDPDVLFIYNIYVPRYQELHVHRRHPRSLQHYPTFSGGIPPARVSKCTEARTGPPLQPDADGPWNRSQATGWIDRLRGLRVARDTREGSRSTPGRHVSSAVTVASTTLSPIFCVGEWAADEGRPGLFCALSRVFVSLTAHIALLFSSSAGFTHGLLNRRWLPHLRDGLRENLCDASGV